MINANVLDPGESLPVLPRVGLRHASRLPRGRHGIPHDLIAANQRERLLSATAEVIAERGYAALVVGDVISRAGVSRTTFYKLFEDKHACVVAAQQRAVDYLLEAIVAACGSTGDWPQGVSRAVEAALSFTAAQPGEARLALASSYAPSEPRLAGQGVAIHRELVALLQRGAEDCPSAREPRGLAAQAAVGAAMSIVGSRLEAGDLADLPGLGPELAQIILAPYLGANESRRIALAA